MRSFDELWHKENLINIGIASPPADWQYVAWIDADVSFSNPCWAVETVQQLHHHSGMKTRLMHSGRISLSINQLTKEQL